MKCYFHYDEETKTRILIPGCWAVVNSNDIDDCYCNDAEFGRFERKYYNTVLSETCKIIADYEKEIKRLNSRVEFWHKKANENKK